MMIATLVLAINLCLLATVNANADVAWNRQQECWTRKAGVCVKIEPNKGCPFSGGSTWWKGCPVGYRCCIPPRQVTQHRPISSQRCGKRPMFTDRDNDDYRVVGGFKAKRGQFPWQVLITYFGKAHCGGAIIADRWILTAAHCLVFYESKAAFRVQAGGLENNGNMSLIQEIEIEQEISHKRFDDPDYANDIALLRLKRPIRFDNLSQPICLPRREDRFTDFICTVSGWGWNGKGYKDYASELAGLNLPTIPYKKCQEAPKSGKYIHKSNLCAGFDSGERDACQGDSGGPLACRANSGQWLLAGVVSWGEGCAIQQEPAVFAKVTYFLDWIEKHTGLRWD